MRSVATAVLTAAAVLVACPGAHAQDPTETLGELAREQSCKALTASTVGIPDQVAADGTADLPASWPAAPTGLLPERVLLRSATETFNRLYAFATRAGEIYVRRLDRDGPWRRMPLPACFTGRVASISADDDELIALDTGQHIYTMDNALKDATLFSWSGRWGTPFWTGPGYALPGGVLAWSWSVVSPVEDRTWTDPAGNRTPIGSGKVSHIWGLRDGGRRLTFWDPWLPLDESYEMCGPHRGRFRALNLSASGSHVFVVGAHGDLFTRLYDFDISGHDPVFFSYSYEDQRGRGDGSPIQLPAEPWRRQPKIPGRITAAISIHKTGVGAIHGILRVEGLGDGGRTGYWERDLAAPASDAWVFHPTGRPLTRPLLDAPEGDTSLLDLGPSEEARYALSAGGTTAELRDFSTYCSPARLHVREADGTTRELLLHHVDGLRQQVRGRGLDDVPRTQPGAIEGPPGTFEPVTVRATRDAITIDERGWTFARTGPAPPAAARCLPRTARIGSAGIGPVLLGASRNALLRDLPAPLRRGARGWRWCVDGGGRVGVTFARGGRVELVTTTAAGHTDRGVGPGSRIASVHAGYRDRRSLGRGLVRTSRRGRQVLVLSGIRVRGAAVASRRLVARPANLRARLRAADPALPAASG